MATGSTVISTVPVSDVAGQDGPLLSCSEIHEILYTTFAVLVLGRLLPGTVTAVAPLTAELKLKVEAVPLPLSTAISNTPLKVGVPVSTTFTLAKLPLHINVLDAPLIVPTGGTHKAANPPALPPPNASPMFARMPDPNEPEFAKVAVGRLAAELQSNAKRDGHEGDAMRAGPEATRPGLQR